MSDISNSDLALPDLALPDLALDASRYDQRLQRINGVTSVWSLPELPDTVKLDLATDDDDEDVGEFLYGLETDLNQTIRPQQYPTIDTAQFVNPSGPSLQRGLSEPQQPPMPNTLFYPEDDFAHEVRRVFSGIAGVPAPKRVSDTAVQDFKTRAIGMGLLSPDTQIDGRWTPDLNGVRGEMAEEDFRRTIAGDRPGAVTVDRTLSMINRWATPTGLLGVAVTLDYLPDVKQIGKEFSGWGDKFRSWWKDKGDPRKFIDAVTGPIDDVVFPVVNTALLFSGVGNVVTFARAASLSDDVVRAATHADDIASLVNIGGRFARAGNVADDVGRFKRASWLATRMTQAHHTTAMQRTGKAMQAWRQYTGVAVTKKAIQQGMRLGFAGQVENLVLPGHEGVGITGAGSQAERLGNFEAWVNRKSTNPYVAGALGLGEMAFTPPSIFHRGAFVDPITDTWAKTQRRVFGLTREKRTASMFAELGINKLAVDDPVRASALKKRLDAGDGRGVLAEIYGNGSADEAAKQLTYLTYAAGLNAYSQREALRLLQSGSGSQFDRIKFGFRNQLVNMVRGADNVDLDTPEGIDLYRAIRSKIAAIDEAPRQVQHKRAEIWRQLGEVLHDPMHPDHKSWLDEAAEDLAHHAEVRSGAYNDLLDAVSPEAVAQVVEDAWGTMGNFDTFQTALHRLGDVTAFVPDGVKLRSIPSAASGDFAHNLMAEELGGALMGVSGKRASWWDGAKLQLAEGRGRLTVARQDAITAQDAQAMLAQTGWLKARQAALGDDVIESGGALLTEQLAPDLEAFATSLRTSVDKLTPEQITSWLDDLDYTKVPAKATSPKRKLAQDWANTITWAARNGVAPGDANTFIKRKLSTIEFGDDWWRRAGVSARGSLDEKVQALRHRIEFLAKEVEVDPALADELRTMGYKPVFGSEFALPDDVLDLAGPLPALAAGDMRRRSLGIFVGYDRGMHDLVHDLRETRLRNVLPSAIRNLRSSGVDVGTWGSRFESGPDVDEFVTALRDGVRNTLEDSTAAARRYDQNGWVSSFTARVASTGLPKSIYRVRKKELQAIFGGQFTDAAYDGIIGALRQAENTGWEYRGLASLEDSLIANSWTRMALKGFAGHPVSHDFAGRIERQRNAISNVVAHPITAVRQADVLSAQRLAGVLRGSAAGVVSADDTETPAWRAALTGGALGYAAPKTAARLVNPRNISRIGGMLMARQVGLASGMDPTAAAATGLAVGFGGTALGRRGANMAVREGGLFDSKGWFQYSKVGDKARFLRDRFRFALNPIWDMQRYTEGMSMTAMADVPQGVSLPMGPRPMKRLIQDLSRDGVSVGADDIRAQWKNAARGVYDYDAIDSMQAWFKDQGIMGFSPIDWQASTYGQLLRQGVDPAQAVEITRKTHMFGMRRTGLEASVNFVFFPFSFQKQFLGNMARFMADDIGRAVVLHDSMKMYDVLSQRYNLDEQWRDHLPILTELREFNPLAFGISPGELGGVNRALVNVARTAPGASNVTDEIANLFLPQAWEIKTAHDWDALRPKVRRLLPIWREAEQFYEDAVREQWNVVDSPSHVAREKEIDLGWEAHRRLNNQLNEFLDQQGVSYSSAMNRRNVKWRALQELVSSKRNEIEDKYPAWRGERARVATIAQERDRELRQILTSPPQELSAPEMATVAFDQALTQLGALYDVNMMSTDDVEGLPADGFEQVRHTAIEMARQVPGFLTYYRTYYQRLYGPIVEDVR